MSEDMMPERIYRWGYSGLPSTASTESPVEYIRADVVHAQIARAEDMATQAIEAWRKATAAHDVIIGQWKVEERMWRDADKKQLAEIAALRDEVVEARRHDARQLNEIELMQAKIVELEADLDAISKAFRLHTRPPTTGA